MENTFAHQNSDTANPCPCNDTVFLLRPSYKSAWTSHLYSLRDAPTKSPTRLFLMMSQQSAKCAVGASGSGVFRDTVYWSEHTRANFKAVAHPDIHMRLWVGAQSAERIEHPLISECALEYRLTSQFRYY